MKHIPKSSSRLLTVRRASASMRFDAVWACTWHPWAQTALPGADEVPADTPETEKITIE